MQTFHTNSDPRTTAADLDMRRLNKQIVECVQIIRAAQDETAGYRSHPAVKMWMGHERSLAEYTQAMLDEWWSRGYTSHIGSAQKVTEYLQTLEDTGWPGWWGDSAMVRSHQSNLVRKAPEHYIPLFPDVPDDIPYVWPTNI
jgi:hypothetical protein